MTAAAMQFDPTFSIGPRSTFTWPGALEHSPSSSSMLNDFASITSHGSDASLTPPSVARSITSSPPRTAFTPEQRELKKQRDLARRDSKLNARMRRTNSQTSSFMDSPPQMPISDVTNAMNLPIYSTAPAPLSLLTEPATSMPGAQYMPSYSPPMPDQAGTGPVFPTPYQQAIPSYGMPMEYPTSYPSPSDYSRPSSLPQDSGLMYQVPAVMNTGTSAPEGGHVRVVQSRPKPRCWEHGCNGRQFSTFSNLLRHQREKSGQATKASCPNCGAEFTRTTARNGHLLHDKCKQRRNS